MVAVAEEFVPAAVTEFDESFRGFELGQPFFVLGHEFVERFQVVHFYEIVYLGSHVSSENDPMFVLYHPAQRMNFQVRLFLFSERKVMVKGYL